MSKTAAQIVDEALGIDANEIERIGRFVDETYPNRAPSIRAQIINHARLLWRRDTDDATARDNVESVAKIKGADFVRPTPSASDYVAFVEKDRVSKGLAWTGADRISALRRAEAMTADEILEAVPSSFKATVAPPVEAKPTPASTMSEAERLDGEILKRTGRDPRGMMPSERQNFHKEIAKILISDAPKAPSAVSQIGRPLTAWEKVNEARRAARK